MMWPWIILSCVFVWLIVWMFYSKIRRNTLVKILRALYERGVLHVDGIKQIYPSHIPKFFVKMTCHAAIKAGLIVRRGLAVIPRYAITEKGRMELDEHDRRRGRKKIPL